MTRFGLWLAPTLASAVSDVPAAADRPRDLMENDDRIWCQVAATIGLRPE